MQLEEIVTKLNKQFPETVTCHMLHGELTIEVLPAELVLICTILQAQPYAFEQLIDICGVDYLHHDANKDKSRFAVVYHLLSISYNVRMRIRCYCNESENSTHDINKVSSLPSVVDVWKSANWYEREAFDLFGIVFTGHPGLKRILMDDDFRDHPLRKDFPLVGKHEVYYDPATKQVEYKPVTIEEKTIIKKSSIVTCCHAQNTQEKP
jgi:NADH-quinone oxidoreductase subunit C